MKLLTYIGSVLMCIGLLFSMSFTSKRFNDSNFEDINISWVKKENTFVTEVEILDMLKNNFNDIEDISINQIPISEIEQKLESNQLLKNAEVYIDLDKNLNIEISTKVPIVRVQTFSGKAFYLSGDAKVFPLSQHYTERILIASGYLLNQEDIDAVYRLAKFISTDDFLKAQIVQIYMRANKDIELIPRVGGHRIVFGKANNVEEKFEKLNLYYEKAIPIVGWRAHKEINLKYQSQIVGVKK